MLYNVFKPMLYKKSMGNSNKVLSIQNISIEKLGNFANFLLSDGYEIEEVLAPEQSLPRNLKDFDAIFILGGPMSVNDHLDYLLQEKLLIQKSIEHGIPLLGICLGSQLIASSCGGKVYRGPKKEIGWGKVNLTTDGKKNLFKHILQDQIDVFQWHGDTYTLPDKISVLSTSNLYVQSFAFKTAYGVQFHVEITKDMVLDWIQKYQKDLKDEEIDINDLVLDIDKRISELSKISYMIYKNFMSLIK